MKIQSHPQARSQAGYSALFITLVLAGATMVLLAATLQRTMTSTRLNDRNCSYVAAGGAAEAAVEKVLARMMVDYATYGEGTVLSNLTFYRTNGIPAASELGSSGYWTNFQWSDGQGNIGRIYVNRTSSASNATLMALTEQFAGLSGYASSYRILANVAPQNTTYSYRLTNVVQQDVQLAQIPVFQFAIFYNTLLEFSDTATLIVRGRVHANSNIYVGSPSDLTFQYPVTTTGTITKPANAGFGVGSWTGAINYNGSPSPGYLTGQSSLTLPIGTNNTAAAVREILYIPPSSEATQSFMGQQRYYNKAGMVLLVSNTTVTLTLKSAASDPSPVVITNWAMMSNWVSTNISMYDYREGDTMKLTQINVTNLMIWMSTNAYVYRIGSTSNKFSTNNPLNILYVADFRSTNSTQNVAIRVVNGLNLPSAGLTIATPNPLYVLGMYNCPYGTYKGTTNTTTASPASFVCDAITLLSPAWSDSYTSGTSLNSRDATDDTVNAAIIAGVVYSTSTNGSTYSGGAMNLPRMLEDWRAATQTLNTSIVCLYNSVAVTTQFVLPGTYYYAPATRNYNFDQNYFSAAKMPPGTPNICRLVRSTWSNPPPNVVNATNLDSWDFVAR